MEPYEGWDNEAWALYKLGWLGVGEGVKLGTGEVCSPLGGGGGDGEG